MGKKLITVSFSSICGITMRERSSLTCIKAVDIMIPVPNCLMTVKASTLILDEKNRVHKMGPRTAIALVARTAKIEPIR